MLGPGWLDEQFRERCKAIFFLLPMPYCQHIVVIMSPKDKFVTSFIVKIRIYNTICNFLSWINRRGKGGRNTDSVSGKRKKISSTLGETAFPRMASWGTREVFLWKVSPLGNILSSTKNIFSSLK